MIGREWVPSVARIVLVASGALQAATGGVYQAMNPDGIAYLDVADAYMRGDWATAVNAVWSPLYSWLLGPVLTVAPAMEWDFAVVQVVNFAIYLGALAGFEFFWSQLTRYARSRVEPGAAGRTKEMPEWLWQVLGYSIFAHASLSLIGVSPVTPDMLMAALLFVAAGLLVKLRREPAAPRTLALLGVVLGLGYLAKSVMFPLALLALALAGVPVRAGRRHVARWGLAFLCFLLTAGPFVVLISQAKARLTIGEAGRLTYARMVNGVPYPHWRGNPDAGQILNHPSRQVLDDPPVFEFADPIHTTYPISFDPSYWYDGVTVRFSPSAQTDAIAANLAVYGELFLPQHAALAFVVLMLRWNRRWPPARIPGVLHRYSVAVLAAVALALYALVLVEGRYIGPFVPLLWGDLLANALVRASAPFGRPHALAVAVTAVLLAGPVLRADLDAARALAFFFDTSPDQRSALVAAWPTETASELRELGVPSGSRVGVIGYAHESYWARLARVRIVAEMFGWDSQRFWDDAVIREGALRAFAEAGAIAIVAEPIYTDLPPGWHRVRNSATYIYLLDVPGRAGAMDGSSVLPSHLAGFSVARTLHASHGGTFRGRQGHAAGGGIGVGHRAGL